MVEWYWVKVIKKGELVIVLDLLYKKFYELLLLGRFIVKKDSLGIFCLSVIKGDEFVKEGIKFIYYENNLNVSL